MGGGIVDSSVSATSLLMQFSPKLPCDHFKGTRTLSGNTARLRFWDGFLVRETRARQALTQQLTCDWLTALTLYALRSSP